MGDPPRCASLAVGILLAPGMASDGPSRAPLRHELWSTTFHTGQHTSAVTSYLQWITLAATVEVEGRLVDSPVSRAVGGKTNRPRWPRKHNQVPGTPARAHLVCTTLRQSTGQPCQCGHRRRPWAIQIMTPWALDCFQPTPSITLGGPLPDLLQTGPRHLRTQLVAAWRSPDDVPACDVRMWFRLWLCSERAHPRGSGCRACDVDRTFCERSSTPLNAPAQQRILSRSSPFVCAAAIDCARTFLHH